jgi:hypothetical protein
MTAREKFRIEVAEVLTDWRLGCIPPRPNGAEAMIFREAMADIIRFRLRIAYMPLFQTLERIQDRVGILANIREDPYAPPTVARND